MRPDAPGLHKDYLFLTFLPVLSHTLSLPPEIESMIFF